MTAIIKIHAKITYIDETGIGVAQSIPIQKRKLQIHALIARFVDRFSNVIWTPFSNITKITNIVNYDATLIFRNQVCYVIRSRSNEEYVMAHLNMNYALSCMDRAVCSIVAWKKVFSAMPREEQDRLHQDWQKLIDTDEKPEFVVEHWFNSLVEKQGFSNAASSMSQDAIQRVMGELTYELKHQTVNGLRN